MTQQQTPASNIVDRIACAADSHVWRYGQNLWPRRPYNEVRACQNCGRMDGKRWGEAPWRRAFELDSEMMRAGMGVAWAEEAHR